MITTKRAGNNPKRRIAESDLLTNTQKSELIKKIKYRGSGHHKRNPADYELERTNPRPTKSLCDAIRLVKLDEAKILLESGIRHGMFSIPCENRFPKYVWAVTANGEVYEAKTDVNTPGVYHGYPLESEDNMKKYVKEVWKQRCQEV